MRLVAHVTGDTEAARELERIAERASDLTGAWERLIPSLRTAERELFATRGHGLWPPNRPSTVRRKGRDTPLFDTGKLYRALTLGGTGSVTRGTRRQLTFGVNDSTIFWSRFVGARRPFIIDDQRAQRLATRTVDDYLMGRA